MAQLLTLSQVRGSPLFAWHPHGYLLIDGELFRAVRMEPPASTGYQGVLSVRRSLLDDADRLVADGWRHVEGCDCELCTVVFEADHGARLGLVGRLKQRRSNGMSVPTHCRRDAHSQPMTGEHS